MRQLWAAERGGWDWVDTKTSQDRPKLAPIRTSAESLITEQHNYHHFNTIQSKSSISYRSSVRMVSYGPESFVLQGSEPEMP